MLLFKYFAALMRSWICALGCIASLVFIALSVLAATDAQIKIFALTAVVFLLLVAIRMWAVERRRAEKAEAETMKGARPRVIVDSYLAARDDGDLDEEYMIETLRIINKGEEPAFAISMRPLQIAGRTARLFASVPDLASGEAKEIRILNLRRTLERAAEKAIKSKGHALSVRLPLTIEYQDSRRERWITEHVVLFGIDGISVDVVRATEPPNWTAISTPRRF